MKKEFLNLKMVSNDFIFHFSKSEAIKQFDELLDTLEFRVNNEINVDYSSKMFNRYYSMRELLIQNDKYEIIDFNTIDTLIDLSFMDKIALQNNNTHLGFRLFFTDIQCMLLEQGEVAIVENIDFISKINMVNYSVSNKLNGRSSVKFYTLEGKEICECPPIVHYN
ncbi:MAG: hypothetical protein HRT71_21490 [Flavobacteriales bacterium]|nr:hypothetical protein [Flavobacteriales bacterium]